MIGKFIGWVCNHFILSFIIVWGVLTVYYFYADGVKRESIRKHSTYVNHEKLLKCEKCGRLEVNKVNVTYCHKCHKWLCDTCYDWCMNEHPNMLDL